MGVSWEADPTTVTLNNGVRMPKVGIGTFQIPDKSVTDVILGALSAGYRLIDTATRYGVEEPVGEAIAKSEVPREEIFVTTKVNNDAHGAEPCARAFDASRRRLGLDVIDLYLVHWPMPTHDLYVETWKTLEKLYSDGKVRAIGVSNFHQQHLQRLVDEADVVPAVNQIEIHPYMTQDPLHSFNTSLGIVTEAWAPLARGTIVSDPVVVALAEKYGKGAGQIVLRWHLQNGDVAIPKSTIPSEIAENLAIFDFELDSSDMGAISALNRNYRTGPNPETYDSVTIS